MTIFGKRIGWLIWAGVLVGLSLSGCSRKFEMNPNLRELKSSYCDLFSPIWAGNGKIYYLTHYPCSNDTFDWLQIFPAQGFSCIRSDGTRDTLLLGDTTHGESSSGRFYSLAYHWQTSRIAILQVEGPILIWDTWADSIVDSVPNPQHYGPLVRWLPDGSGLLVSSGFDWEFPDTVWKVSLGDSVYTPYGTCSECGFEVNPDGSLYTELPWPSFCPEDSSYVVYGDRCNPSLYELLMQTPSGGVNLQANPYEISWFYRHVSWSPGGESIVFAAGVVAGDPLVERTLELWILEDVR